MGLIRNKIEELRTIGTTIDTTVNSAVSGVIDAAPSALNTLNELAAALNDDANFSSTVATQLATKVNKTGDRVTGALTVDTGYQSGLKVIRDYNVANGVAGQAIQMGAKLNGVDVLPIEIIGVVDIDGTAYQVEVRMDGNLQLRILPTGEISTYGALTSPRLRLSNDSSNGDIHFLDASSSDLYMDVVPGTRTVRLRNWNKASPNIESTSLQTGKLFLKPGTWTTALEVQSTNKTFALYNEWANKTNTVSFGNTTDGIECINIDQYGRVMTPNQPAFHAWGDTSTAGGYFVFTQTRVNRGNCYNTSNGRFTAPVPGVYSLTGQMFFSPDGTTRQVNLHKNGGSIAEAKGAMSGSYANLHVTQTVFLNAGDYIQFHSAVSGNQLNGGDYTYLTGHLLG